MMVEGRKNTIVIASAGTGKTYRLVTEFVDTVLGNQFNEPIHPRSILALTFTEKAAAEMKSRISQRFAEHPPTQHREWMRELEQATVTTYHAFCAKILREYASHIGIDRSFRLMDTYEELQLAKRVASRVVLKKLKTQDKGLISLVARFGFASDSNKGGLVNYLIRIREQIIESGIDPNSMKGVPQEDIYSIRSSQSLKEILLEGQNVLSRYETLKLTSTALEKVRQIQTAFSELSGMLLSDEDTSLEIKISSVFSRLKIAASGRFGPDEIRKELLKTISLLGKTLCDAALVAEYNSFLELLRTFFADIHREKKESMSLAFADLLLLTRDLLKNDPDLRKDIKSRYMKVLVDEYQDTSPIQEEIVALLCESLEREKNFSKDERVLQDIALEQGKLFVVGDPKQSIYGFRGSDVSLFNDMAQEIARQDGIVETLNVSRRSSGGVVRIVNQVIPCDEREKLASLRDECLVSGGVLKSESEPSAIANEVNALLTGKSNIACNRSFEPRDIAILVRRIKKSQAILEELSSLGISAQIFGGEGFFDRLEVMDFVNALKLVNDSNDSAALLGVLRSPFVNFSDDTILDLFERISLSKSEWSFDAVCQLIGEVANESEKQKYFTFSKALESIKSKIDLISAQEAMDILLDETHYLSGLSDSNWSLCAANIEKLRDLFIRCKSDFIGQVSEIAQRMKQAAKEAMGEESIRSNAVQIMTIHQSKGLEFPVVIIADTSASIPSESADILFDSSQGLAISYRGRPIAVCAPDAKEWQEQFPTKIQAVRRSLRDKAEKELVRLLYVGLTRARDYIYVCDSTHHSMGDFDKRCTLRNLFFENYTKASDEWRGLMPEVKQAVFTQREEKFSSQSEVNLNTILEDAENKNIVPEKKLLYASRLGEQEELGHKLRGERLVLQPGFAFSPSLNSIEIGSLAHHLIRTAAGQLSLHEYQSQEIVRSALTTSLRLSQAPQADDHDALLEKCAKTLDTVIFPLLQSGFSLQFEVSLILNGDRYVVKGFADMIATRDDIVCVIDFKSSEHSANSENTKRQLLTYCAALKESSQRLFFASSVIGSSLPLEFCPFGDDELEEVTRYLKGL